MGHMAPFAARAPQHIKRLAMLIAISSWRDSITEADLKSAITIYSYTEQRLQEVIVPSNQIGKILAAVLDAVPPQGATEKQVARACKNLMTPQDAAKHLQGLFMSGDLKYIDGTFYKEKI
jgi:hypothetical protein